MSTTDPTIDQLSPRKKAELLAAEADPEAVREWAQKDSDFDSVRDDPRFQQLASPAT
jgi:hypothetical protein